MSNMYPDAKTVNFFVGCEYDCVYCRPSFQRQLKRVAGVLNCQECYDYSPHYHPERLATSKIPSAPIVFVDGTGDITFCKYSYMRKTFKVIEKHRPQMDKTYYFQSKNPVCFTPYLDWFLENQDIVILVTTLETNRDAGYREISQAPLPTARFNDFYDLDYPRKVLTIEPVLDFDLEDFVDMVLKLHRQDTLEYVWFGFDSKNCGLPEPSIEKAQMFVDVLQSFGIEVRGKTLRGVKLKNETKQSKETAKGGGDVNQS